MFAVTRHCAGVTDPGARLPSIDDAGRWISAATAKQQIDLYRSENPNGIRAVTFSRDLLMTALEQKAVAGIRFYVITDKHGNRNLMFVGIDVSLNDLRFSPNVRGTTDGGSAGSYGRPCPN